jgi:hypothetical protein
MALSEMEEFHHAFSPCSLCGSTRPKAKLLPALLIAGLMAIMNFVAPTTTHAGEISIGISVRIGPPPLPVYTQPVCPAPGYMWTPGYWAYDPENGYFWVPGTWVMAPSPGMFWTPGYWGWGGSAFLWHAGYWGPHVGFYGGVNYGYGYTGRGFEGGEWRGGTFFYNRSVANVTNITNVYNRTVINNYSANRVSYNGGTGGLSARPTPGELAAAHDRHIEAIAAQREHEVGARSDRSQFAAVNHGAPGVAATGRPGDFRGGGVVHSTRAGGPVNPEVYHASAPPHTNTYAGGRGANPGGGGNHPLMTAHPNAPVSHGAEPTARGGGGGYHPSSPPHVEEHKSAPPHQAESHARQPQEHGSKPSGEGKGGKPEEQPRR